MENSKKLVVSDIVEEVFEPRDHVLTSSLQRISTTEAGQDLYYDLLKLSWVYSDKSIPDSIFEYLLENNETVCGKVVDHHLLETAVYAVYLTTRVCENLDMEPSMIKDIGSETLEEYMNRKIQSLSNDNTKKFFTKIVSLIYGRNEHISYNLNAVLDDMRHVGSILRKMNRFIINRDVNTVPEYHAEGDSENNGPDSDPEQELLTAMMNKTMLPEKTYSVDDVDGKIEVVSEDEEDYFSYSDRVHKITNRYCNHRAVKCPCMYSCRYVNPENPFGKHNGYKIDEESYRDLCAIISELPTCIVSNDPRKDYKNHFVVRIALTTADKNIRSGCSRSKEEIMQKIYRLRSFYVDDLPPQLKLKYEEFVAEEGNDEERMTFIEKIKTIFNLAGSCLKTSVQKVSALVKKMFVTISEFISDKISQLIEKAFTKIADMVIGHFDVESFIRTRILKLKEGTITAGRKVAFAFIVILFIIASEILSFFVFRFAKKMIFSLLGLFKSEEDNCFDVTNVDYEGVSEGMTPVAAVATIACAGFGLASGKTKIIKEKCDFLSSVFRAGAGISLSLGALFVILPTVFTDSMTLAWGSPEEKDAIICEDWIIKTTCLLRLSKIAKILASKEMMIWVKEQLNAVPELIKIVKTSGYRSMVLKMYSDLLRVSSNLEQYHNSEEGRQLPYSIHLSAKPGFGKSLLAPTLITRCFDHPAKDIYTRNQTEEYWSGYIAQPIVFVDEFLVNKDPTVVNRSTDEYLKLVSPSKFTPEFASTDNITVGLKGTSVNPEIVITANNSNYQCVPGFPNGALDRRRRFVIEMYKNPAKAHLWSGNAQIDVGKMTNDDLYNATWLLFDVRNNARENPVLLQTGISFRELIAFIRDDFTRYKEDCDKIRSIYNSADEDSEDPTAKLMAMMAEMKGAPRGTFNYDNPFSTLASGAMNFFSEGRKTRPSKNNKVHSDDDDSEPRQHPCSLYPEVTVTDANDSDTSESYVDSKEVIDSEPVTHTNVINRDIPADVYCSNVDRTKLHRHICLVCDKHEAMRRCDGAMHLRCKSCEHKKAAIPLIKIASIITPDNNDITEEEMEAFRAKRIEDMKKLAAACRFTAVYHESFPMTIWDEMGNVHDYHELLDAQVASWKARAKLFAIVLGAYIGIVYLRRLINKQAKETESPILSFIPESQGRRKETQTKKTNRYRATNWKGESVSFPGLKYYLTVEGKVLSHENGMPICASKFITHRHSLLNESGELYTHGTITVCYKDGIDTVPYNCNMIRELKVNDVTCDFVMVCLPPRMKINGFPNMLNKFWRDEDFAKFNGGDVCIVQPDGSTVTTRASVQHNRTYVHRTTTHRVGTGLTYSGVGNGPGWCGLILESYGHIGPGMYIGMHVAGSGSKGRSDGLYGLAMPITREMLEQLINYNDDMAVPELITFEAESNVYSGPGLVSVELLPPRERVILSRVSKIRPSAIVDEMPELPKKHMPLLNSRDPRAENEDPLVNMINDTLSKLPPKVDEKRADRAVLGTLHHLRKNLTWIFPKRRLTFEEAVGGVPGLLTSMNRHTSAGYPLCKITKGQGKKEYFWFGEDGVLGYDPVFRDLVENFIKEFDEGRCEKGRFVAYLKDELVSEKKINQKRCRIIYGGDMIANTAFRMIFGSFVIAYNHSYDKLSHVVGLNQYSYDMDIIHSYLTEVGDKFVAGDFKGWDKNMNAYIQKKCYWAIMQVCSTLIDGRNFESFYQHQVKSPVIVEKHLLTLENTQFSGCFFTTILNCLVHDAMLRYIYDLVMEKAGKNLEFEANVRAKILGDDHIYCFSNEAAVYMNPKTIQEAYAEIGSEYTDDLKDANVGVEFRPFEDLTFLGAHPRIINGKWVGALKKDTIYEMVLWTRNFNEDLEARCLTAIEMSSLWGEEFYVERASLINSALRRRNFNPIEVKPWSIMVHDVINRTAASELTFPRFIAEGNEGLVNLNAINEHSADGLNKTTMLSKLRGKAVAELPQDLAFGLESTVFRTSFEWATTDIAGKAIQKIPVPFGLLGLGDSDNVQNMPFDRFLFWNGDVKLTFQVNGTPFMCGMLAIYFMPLASYESELANISTTNHVYLQPDKNNTVELTIPFVYFRSVMNTVARATESLGTVFVTPMSPLSSVDSAPVTISVYSSFPKSLFSIPRPLPVVRRTRRKYYSAYGVEESSELTLPVSYVAEGASQSTSITNNYQNVGGTMPISDITNTASPDLDFAQDISPDLKIPVGLDNPPIASGAVPVELAYPGFSNSFGLRPTRDLQLMPATFARQQCMIFDPVETRIDVNCQRSCLMATIPISTSMTPNTSLMELSLDSRLNVSTGNNIPVNVAILNQFFFWRGDIEFTFVMVRTQYHSCRLQGVVAYGVDAIETGSRSVAYSNIMDFSGENSVSAMTVQFNAQTEFLRTYEGSKIVDPTQNHSMGTFGLFITNQLVAPETVPQTVNLLVFVRFLNVKVAVPRAFSPFTWNGYGELTANEETSGTVVSLPQASGESWPVWCNEMLNNGFLPIVTGSPLAVPDGVYTAFCRLNLTSSEGTWTSEIRTIRVTGSNVGAIFDNMGINYRFPSDDGVLASSPVGPVRWNAISITFPSQPLTFYVPIAPAFIAEGAETETEITETDHVEPNDITSDSEERPNIPHKVEPLAKFEFCPTDIVEIGRRYVRVHFIENPSLDQSIKQTQLITGDLSRNYTHAATQLSSMWRGLFAAWAGSIKYRFFTEEPDFLEIMFQPFFNGDQQFGVSVGDVVRGSVVRSGVTVVSADTSVVGPYAREMGFPSWHRQYVDVSVPFQSHFNFLFTSKTQEVAPISSGTITMSGAESGEEIRVYSAFGDDLRLGVYRPPLQTNFSLSAFVDGINGYWA
nr:putative polyprotein [Drosophila-associated picorna-like virus]